MQSGGGSVVEQAVGGGLELNSLSSSLDALLMRKVVTSERDSVADAGAGKRLSAFDVLLLQDTVNIDGGRIDWGRLYEALNRNARKPRKANKGKRPCSRIARRAKRRKNGNFRRGH